MMIKPYFFQISQFKVMPVKPLSPHLWRRKEYGWTPLLYKKSIVNKKNLTICFDFCFQQRMGSVMSALSKAENVNVKLNHLRLSRTPVFLQETR
jgi:hypothetical protein